MLLSCAVCLPAWSDPGSPIPVAGANLEDLLNLNGDQRSRLRDVNARYRTLKRDLALAVGKLRQQLVAQMSKDVPDRSQVERTLLEIVQVEGRRQRVMVDEFFDVMGVLSPEQRRLFREQVVKHIVRGR